MCELVREQQARAMETGAATQPPGPARLRPVWAAAVVAALVGGVAVAALVAPQPAAPIVEAKQPAAPAPVVSKVMAAPPATVIEQGSTGLDDGVPGYPSGARAGGGDCHHSL